MTLVQVWDKGKDETKLCKIVSSQGQNEAIQKRSILNLLKVAFKYQSEA